MRQYSRAGWIIVINMWAMLGVGAFAAGPAPVSPDIADYVWYREAANLAMEQQTLPPVEITSVTIEQNVVTAHLEVRGGFVGNSLDFVLVAPAGGITSASLTAHDIQVDAETEIPPNTDDLASTAAKYQTIFHEQSVQVKHLAYVRGHRLVKVQASPTVSSANGARLKSGTLQITYRDILPENGPSETPASGSSPLSEMVEQLVANPADLMRFALPLDQAPVSTSNESPPLGDGGPAVARFETTGDGFVRFTGADLARVGVNLSATDVGRLSVWADGEPVQLITESASSRPIASDDEFAVYAQENKSTYTTKRMYWIRTDKATLSSPSFMQQPLTASAANLQYYMAQQTVQQDSPPVLTKNDQFLTILGYRWVWWTWTPTKEDAGLPLPRGYDQPGVVDFDLPGLSDVKETATLALHFYSHKWPRESGPVLFHVQLNGAAVGRIEVAEPNGLEHSISVPQELLKSKSNQVILTPETTSSTVSLPELCFDRLEIRYPRSYVFVGDTLEFTPPSDNGGRITLGVDDSSTAILIADTSTTIPRIFREQTTPDGKLNFTTEGPASRRYVAATPAGIKLAALTKFDMKVDLRSAANHADLIVISAPEFIKDLQPWVDRKTAKGHVVSVIDVNDIYDQFGYGHQSPHAIRTFLRYAAVHWQGSDAGPAASVILMVGDSTSAYRNEFRNDVVNYVPTMSTTMGGDVFASDQWYVSLFGDDAFADALIGRFSVNTTEDLRNVLQKQLDYESASAPGAWRNTLGFIADHSEFEDSVDRIMKQVVPPRFFLDRIMMSELPWIDNYYFPKEVAEAQQAKVSPAATGRIRDLFNNGAAVVTYFGHGSPNIWSTERMWFGGDSPNSDNLLLTNRDRLSIVINMTCNSGAIDYPQPRWNVNISEDFMRVPNGGAVACFVPSGPGLTVQHERLMMEIGKVLFGADHYPLGQSLQLALWRYLSAGNPEDLARMYILLGDPLLMPHIAAPVGSSRTAGPKATQWPGTIVLPPDITGDKEGGTFQLHRYQDAIDSRAIQAFTSTTLALPMPRTASDSAQSLALAVQDGIATASASASTFIPVSVLPALKLLQWKRTDDTADGDATATLEFRIRNESPLPFRAVRLVLTSEETGTIRVVSAPLNFQPSSDGVIRMTVATAPGLTPLMIGVSDGSNELPLESIVPLAVVGLRPDSVRDKIPPATIDRRSITTAYRKAADKVTATVTAQVHLLASEPLSNLRVGLEDPEGAVVQGSITSVPPAGPGEATRISLSVDLPADATPRDYKFRFDPAGYFPEFTRFPAETIALGAPYFSDVAIVSVVPSNSSPTVGETVFFDVKVSNIGAAKADGIRVEGFQKISSGTQEKLKNQVTLPNPSLNLKPGATQIVRLRWDPFQNAGKNDLLFTATNSHETADRNPANNQSSLSIVARTKASLHTVRAGVLPLSKEDAATTQIRVLARVRNDGQSDAQGLRVAFYSSPTMIPATYMGETEIDTIVAGGTKDAILVYKLKPGEERRPFNITFEVTYKGSRQRILMQ